MVGAHRASVSSSGVESTRTPAGFDANFNSTNWLGTVPDGAAASFVVNPSVPAAMAIVGVSLSAATIGAAC